MFITIIIAIFIAMLVYIKIATQNNIEEMRAHYNKGGLLTCNGRLDNYLISNKNYVLQDKHFIKEDRVLKLSNCSIIQ